MNRLNNYLNELSVAFICSNLSNCQKCFNLQLVNTIFPLDFDDFRSIKQNNGISIDEYQKILSNINEKGKLRKSKGVYYTDDDVTNFLVANSFLQYTLSGTNKVYAFNQAFNLLKSKCDMQKVINVSVFDPTCGAGQFLISSLKIKLSLLKIQKSNILDNDYLMIVNSLFGNDISELSIKITQCRIFSLIAPKLNSLYSLKKLVIILKHNFSSYDFVYDIPKQLDNKFDIILGNPPYVEYKDLDKRPLYMLYNSYANVLYNASYFLKEHSFVSFVVPISFVSTKRMDKIRKFFYELYSKITVLNFSDRPDCLFDGVHQKLSLILSEKNSHSNLCNIFSSSYKYWYKSERPEIFNNLEILRLENKFINEFDDQIPKISNCMELSIIKKLTLKKNISLKSILENKEKLLNKQLFLNMRQTFWCKCFSYNPGTSGYKCFNVDSRYYYIVLCLLNSSLFYFFWVIVSDCWHITNKELSLLKVPQLSNDTSDNFKCYEQLSKLLEKELELTKKYVGTVQVAYEYKHKSCKHLIDQIDDKLGQLFNLSEKEIEYIKNYNLKYRIGNE